MSEVVEALRRARASGDAQALVDVSPYARWLGITAHRVGGELRCKLPFAERHVGNPAVPAIHGGVIGALLEAAAACEVLRGGEGEREARAGGDAGVVGEGAREGEAMILAVPRVVTITVDYLRSAGPVDTWARGVVLRRGRRVVNVRAEAWQDDPSRPVAMAVAHFLVVPPGLASPHPAATSRG